MTDAQKRYETERHALFFKEEACKDLYKDHVRFLVNRVNSINGELTRLPDLTGLYRVRYRAAHCSAVQSVLSRSRWQLVVSSSAA